MLSVTKLYENYVDTSDEDYGLKQSDAFRSKNYNLQEIIKIKETKKEKENKNNE